MLPGYWGRSGAASRQLPTFVRPDRFVPWRPAAEAWRRARPNQIRNLWRGERLAGTGVSLARVVAWLSHSRNRKVLEQITAWHNCVHAANLALPGAEAQIPAHRSRKAIAVSISFASAGRLTVSR